MMISAMIKTVVLCFAAFSLSALLPCVAQQGVVPVIQLSASESAKAKQLAQDLKDAQERSDKAIAAWRAFQQTFQAAHPDLPGVTFTSDFRLAFSPQPSPDGFVHLITAVALTPEEQQKGAASQRELGESKKALDQARQGWREYQYQIAADHFPGMVGSVVTLASGKQLTIAWPWSNPLAFTPDFRFAVPQ
ncbi:MAG: hypothetical protein ACREIC_31865 [Limisphaerales bacterium]